MYRDTEKRWFPAESTVKTYCARYYAYCKMNTFYLRKETNLPFIENQDGVFYRKDFFNSY